MDQEKSVYFWVTGKLGATRKMEMEPQTIYDLNTLSFLNATKTPTPHALGNAFFSILEAREGTGIHKEIMAGRYQLPPF